MSRSIRCASVVLAASTAVVVFLGQGSAIAQNASTEIPLPQVPKAVMATVMKWFPDAQPQSASRGMDGNKPFFDVFIKAKQRSIWVTCDPQGGLLVVDREIALQEVPKPVADAIGRKYPRAAIRLLNEITDSNQTHYDIALTFNNKQLIVLFLANGQFVEEMPDDPPSQPTK
jgi:hypothetical protein